MQEQAKEQEENPLTIDFFDEDNKMIPTEKAEKAKKILSDARLIVTLEEMKKLQEQSREKIQDPIFGKMMPTNKAVEANKILLQKELTIINDRILFRTTDIGKETINVPILEKNSVMDVEKEKNNEIIKE